MCVLRKKTFFFLSDSFFSSFFSCVFWFKLEDSFLSFLFLFCFVFCLFKLSNAKDMVAITDGRLHANYSMIFYCLINIIGRNCHKYHFCRNSSVTQTRVCRDKTSVVTKMILVAAPANDRLNSYSNTNYTE